MMHHDQLHRTRTLWLCTVLHAFTHGYQFALIPLYLLIQKDFQLASEAQATFLVTALTVIYFLPSYPMGILADRVSRKKLLAIGLLINGAAFVGLSFAPSYWMALVCIIIAGLAGSFYHPAATALIARIFPDKTGAALGKVGMGSSIGFFLAPLYVGWRADAVGWRQPVLEIGLFGIIGAGLFAWLAKEHPNRPTQNSTAPKLNEPQKETLFSTPALWALFLGMSLLFGLRDFAGSGMATLGSLFLQHAHGFDASRTGWTLSCLYCASVISNPLFGHLSDKGRIRWTIVVLIAAAAAVFVFPHLPSNWLAIDLLVYGFFMMASYPIIEAALMQSVPDAVRGRVYGIFITISGIIGNLAHWAVGTWVKQLGESAKLIPSYYAIYTGLGFLVLVSMAALICLHALRKRETTPAATTPVPLTSLKSST